MVAEEAALPAELKERVRWHPRGLVEAGLRSAEEKLGEPAFAVRTDRHGGAGESSSAVGAFVPLRFAAAEEEQPDPENPEDDGADDGGNRGNRRPKAQDAESLKEAASSRHARPPLPMRHLDLPSGKAQAAPNN